MRLFWVRALCFFFLSGIACSSLAARQLALLDTAQREQALYQPFINSAQAAGFQVSYVSIDHVMDQEDLFKTYQDFDGIFFLFSMEFLKGMQQQSPVSQKIMDLLSKYASLENKLTGLIFPPVATASNAGPVMALLPIFEQLGRNVRADLFVHDKNNKRANSMRAFLGLTNRFISVPMEARSLPYQTTLSVPHSGHSFFSEPVNQLLRAHKARLNVLPFRSAKNFPASVRNAFPYALYWHNPFFNNHVFVSSKTLCTFSGITESFRVCPVDHALRNKMHEAMDQMMVNLNNILDKKRSHSNPAKVPDSGIANAGTLAPSQNVPVTSKYDKHFRKIAWMELPIFEDKDYKDMAKGDVEKDKKERAVRQTQLINHIFDSGMNALWISLTPNIYYSPIAKYKEKEKVFMGSVVRFTKKLSAAAKRTGKPLPKILVGFEIADNIYEPNLPKQFAWDLYNNRYEDVPSPISKTFWENEVKLPLQTFVHKWQDPTISHGVPLSGVVIDLEMYGRRKSDMFLNVFGFSPELFTEFTQNKKNFGTANDAHQIARQLMKNKATTEYFSFLEQQAQNVGSDLKDYCEQLIPGCLMSCYAATLHVDWFYKGFFKGLSSAQKPVYVSTFNTEFKQHQDWFAKNDSNVRHLGVLLLSKIKNLDQKNWVDTILKEHHGIWLNRFSRLVEKYEPTSWISVEQSPLEEGQKKQLMKYLALQP
ncbi:hypothetical protein K2W90_00750 [Candidatus Babeliales bacterium]|nr:hypothetical protein [Candidatus Babeliales bacterium]